MVIPLSKNCLVANKQPHLTMLEAKQHESDIILAASLVAKEHKMKLSAHETSNVKLGIKLWVTWSCCPQTPSGARSREGWQH